MNELLDPLLLARWQFGLTTLYHFLFVPLTIGMALTVAIFQTAWYRTGKAEYLRLTRFFGRIFLINFAMGVVTGIVQEFQFGMNWSAYSRFVGDVFGAPLAFEGLMAFFFEATFIGLWIFGWDKLPRGLHLATIWIAAIGAIVSAYFILAANAFMQNPVGFKINAEKGRAEIVDFVAVLTNPVALAAFPHTIAASFMMTAGVDHHRVAAWHLARKQNLEMMRPALRYGLWVIVASPASHHALRRPAEPRDGRDAADEDGGRRGDVRHRVRRGRLVLALHARHPRRHERAVLDPRALPARAPVDAHASTAASRASTT